MFNGGAVERKCVDNLPLPVHREVSAEPVGSVTPPRSLPVASPHRGEPVPNKPSARSI